VNNTAAIGSNFDRVGYCLELNGPKGVQWVWTAMAPFTTDAKRLGLQTFAGQIFRQQVTDLEVSSNVAGVTNGTGQTGYIEMWPNQYSGTASGQVPNAAATYDADDSPTTVLGHGSFQIHQIGATKPSTVPPSRCSRSTGSLSRPPMSWRSASVPTPPEHPTGP